MATTDKAPSFIRVANKLTMSLLRAGVKVQGPYGFFGGYPMYLVTIAGRKSGQPRTVPLVILEQEGKRYLASPYGIVDWVRNLRAAGEAVLTRGRHTETVSARELSGSEAAHVLQAELRVGNPFMRFMGITRQSTLDEMAHAAAGHPVFLLERK